MFEKFFEYINSKHPRMWIIQYSIHRCMHHRMDRQLSINSLVILFSLISLKVFLIYKYSLNIANLKKCL